MLESHKKNNGIIVLLLLNLFKTTTITITISLSLTEKKIIAQLLFFFFNVMIKVL